MTTAPSRPSGPGASPATPLAWTAALDRLDVSRTSDVLQRVDLELYRDNIPGALALLERAHAATGEPRYLGRAQEIRAWLRHLTDPGAYVGMYEDYYHQRRGLLRFKRLERDLRILLGWKTRKTLKRVARHPEFQLLEQQVTAHRPARVLDAGCGEGRVAITLGARHPELSVTAVDVSPTNVRIARRVNRFPNVRIEETLIERFTERAVPESFDLAYSFAVLEHVADVDDVVARILGLLRPGGRFCFVVPMNELTAVAPLPPFVARDGVLGHVRCFSDSSLRAAFGKYGDFQLVKLPSPWRPDRYPAGIVPIEYGAFFVAFSKTS